MMQVHRRDRFINLWGRAKACGAPGGYWPKRGKGAPQNLEEQDLEEKLLHVEI